MLSRTRSSTSPGAERNARTSVQTSSSSQPEGMHETRRGGSSLAFEERLSRRLEMQP
jgi:hypothetical protein